MEFALILPVLLLILFGIIEIARLLQAWLAVENAARFAVRYAVTGSFDPQFCDEATAYYLTHNIPGLSPAATLSAGDDTYDPDGAGPAPADPANDCNIPSGVANFQEKTEAVTDWARLASIQNVSRHGAPGTFIQDSVSGNFLQYLSNTATQFYTPGYQTYRGDPTAPGFFNVAICSNRNSPVAAGLDSNPYYYNQVASDANLYPQPCVVDSNYIDDAGGPGNRVRVVITFRHPMIMPFLSSLWPSVRLSAQREGIVEQFRTARNIVLPSGIGVIATWTNTPTITPTPSKTSTSTPSATVTKTFTPSATPTRTLTPTSTSTTAPSQTLTPSLTPTKTATANCAQFSIGAFTQTNTGGASPKPRMQINVTNGSAQATTITNFTFIWAAYDSLNPGQTFDASRWPDTLTTLSPTDDSNSPTSWTGSAALNAGQTGVLSLDFKNADAAWPGNVTTADFGLTLTLGNGCTLTVSAQPTKTPTITNTPTKTLTPTITPTPTITFTPSKTFTPSQTFTPSHTPTKTATKTITPTPTITLTPSKTNTPTITPTPSQTPLASPTPTRTPTRTITPTPTNTVGPSPTQTPTRTQTMTPTKTNTPFTCPYSPDNPNYHFCFQTPPPAVWP